MQTAEQTPHLAGDVLREAEGASILGHPNGSIEASPAVDILEEVPVHGAIVRGREAAGRKRLFSPYGDAQRLKAIELGLIA